jgi:uncharacterized protein DUF4062
MTAPAARAGATPAKQTNHIFVSSTSIDLQEYRAKVTETVLQLGLLAHGTVVTVDGRRRIAARRPCRGSPMPVVIESVLAV